jgi:hypothetical protein
MVCTIGKFYSLLGGQILKAKALTVLLLTFGTAQGADDRLLKAVTFALTGMDDAHVTALDWDQCVFRVDEVNVTETYHLGNVDPARTTFARGRSTSQYGDVSYFVDVSIFGEGTVYEILSRFVDKNGAPLIKRESASDQLRLVTREYERVVRAWKYIYLNGCKGRQSSF